MEWTAPKRSRRDDQWNGVQEVMGTKELTKEMCVDRLEWKLGKEKLCQMYKSVIRQGLIPNKKLEDSSKNFPLTGIPYRLDFCTCIFAFFFDCPRRVYEF